MEPERSLLYSLNCHRSVSYHKHPVHNLKRCLFNTLVELSNCENKFKFFFFFFGKIVQVNAVQYGENFPLFNFTFYE
jgi:hypothetical protein